MCAQLCGVLASFQGGCGPHCARPPPRPLHPPPHAAPAVPPPPPPQVDPVTKEVAGVYITRQKADDDLGSKQPADVQVG